MGRSATRALVHATDKVQATRAASAAATTTMTALGTKVLEARYAVRRLFV